VPLESQVQILSVDGGGYLGLATTTFVEGLEHHFGSSLADRFDLFCGTSTGAIIALGLAIGKSGADLRQLYITLGQRVLCPRLGRGSRAARLVCPKYALEPLREALTDAFGDATLADVLARGKKVVATSFCLTTGQPRFFKTNHSANLTLHAGYRVVDIALASAAAPIYFPLVRIQHPVHRTIETFCDGGVVTNQPALVAYAEAVSELAIPPRDVRLLSLSTPRSDLSAPEPISPNRGLRDWGWGEKLAETFIEGGARMSGEALKRIVGCYPAADRPVYERIELHNRHRLAFDDVSPRATEALVLEGSSEAASNDIRRRVAVFFR
jgi:patatin-like phospholipase/acyl hydrolase